MQKTINNIDDDAFVMQIYDAIIGDASSYRSIVKEANKQFVEVNESYSMLKAERDAWNRLKSSMKDKVERANRDRHIWT